MFLERVSQDFNLPIEQLSKLYLETAEQAIKVPRKYTKKPKEVVVATEGAESPPVKATKEPKAKAEKQQCTACTSKKEPCKFSALKGEVFCKRHLRASQEQEGEPVKKAAKKPAAKKDSQPVHTHPLEAAPSEPCALCESHGNPLTETEGDFEVAVAAPSTGPVKTVTVAERLAALLADTDSEAEEELEGEPEEAEYEVGGEITEEMFEDE